MDKLMELAATCERVDGLLAEEVVVRVIYEAWWLLNPIPQANGESWGGDGLGPYTEEYKAWEKRRVQIKAYLKAGAFLDAALSLVSERCPELKMHMVKGSWRAIVWVEGRNVGLDAVAKTPALALTAAALRARAS